MAIYRLEKDNYSGTSVEVESTDKILFNRLEIAIDHVFKERAKELEKKIADATNQIYERLNMNGVVRIDYILDKATNTLYFNEINTIPGSMAFYLYEPLGIDYIELVENIIENAEDIKKFAYFNTQILKDKKI